MDFCSYLISNVEGLGKEVVYTLLLYHTHKPRREIYGSVEGATVAYYSTHGVGVGVGAGARKAIRVRWQAELIGTQLQHRSIFSPARPVTLLATGRCVSSTFPRWTLNYLILYPLARCVLAQFSWFLVWASGPVRASTSAPGERERCGW